MFSPKGTMFVILVVTFMTIAPFTSAQETKQFPTGSGQVDDSTHRAEREAMYFRYLDFASYIKGGSITPNWMADGSSFWYAEGAPANTVIWKVDPKANPSAGLRAGTKTPLFDAARLRQALTEALGHEPPHQGVPFRDFSFREGETGVEFKLDGQTFVLSLADYSLSRIPERKRVAREGHDWWLFSPDGHKLFSPDSKWAATIRDWNLWFISLADGDEVRVTTDGVEDFGYSLSGPVWSPDGSVLALTKVDRRHLRRDPVVVRWLEEPKEVRRTYAEFTIRFELLLVHRQSKRIVPVRLPEHLEEKGSAGQRVPILGWDPTGSTIYFLRTVWPYEREIQLVSADAETGATRVLSTESGPNTVATWAPWAPWVPRPFHLLADGKKFILMSERDGWKHLYLYSHDGTLRQRLTQGQFPVVRVVAVDEKSDWVYFTARTDRRRPYDSQLCRVRLDGTDFQRLTPDTGEHDVPAMPLWGPGPHTPIQMAPSKQFFVATHSTPSRPPVTELRRADGSLVRVLSEANVDALAALGWSPPEEFVVKAADGETDLYGVLYKPYDFDPSKKYPVIEMIYARHQRTIIPTTFASNWWGVPAQALAQLGFITFIVEGRGTSERGKAFHDAIYGKVGRVEIEDHVAALRQLAAHRPYMDLSRVGIKGNTHGGYYAIRALLLAPDLYRVAVASAPPAMTGKSVADHPFALFLGPPEENEEAYHYASNLNFADRLEGKLLLIHGTADDYYPLSGTLQFIEALIQAKKPYDLMLMPDRDHAAIFRGPSGDYRREAIRRYFQEHLKP